MKLSLGPISYYWQRNKVLDFYADIKKSPVDIVYLGETVCSKRKEMQLDDWLAIAEELASTGKEVVLSTLALITARSEIQTLKKICANGKFSVEANDLAAVQILSEHNLPFVCGSSINIYNASTLRILQQKGMTRWLMPVELSAETLSEILSEAKSKWADSTPETEVFSFGKIPLAYSARCFTARSENRPKDKCELACLNNPDGIELRTQEAQELFTINGIQTQSGARYNLLSEWKRMQSIGVDIMRISPQSENIESVIKTFHNSINGINTETIPVRDLSLQENDCNGYWHGEPGMYCQPPTL